MTDSQTYSVVMNGEIITGYEPKSVTDAFARLFKITPEKADTIVGSKRVLKKDVELKIAETYKQKLRSIGLEIDLVKNEPVVTQPNKIIETKPKPQGLALEPIQEESQKKDEPPRPNISNAMICPKCSLEQPKSEQCTGCGVFVHKVQNKVTEDTNSTFTPPKQEQVEQKGTYPDSNFSSLKMFIIPVVVAIFGALLWKFIAVSFEREFSMVAWFIGGAVGLSAAMVGAKGQVSAVMCGALVLLAIIAGKTMALASFQTDLLDALAESSQIEGVDLHEPYDEQLNDARQFSNTVASEDSLREFMVTYKYSESYDKEFVTDEEIANFNQYEKPMLEQMAYNPPNFEEWKDKSLTSRIENISAFDLVIQSLGLIDLLFIFFGVGTAFKLGYGQE